MAESRGVMAEPSMCQSVMEVELLKVQSPSKGFNRSPQQPHLQGHDGRAQRVPRLLHLRRRRARRVARLRAWRRQPHRAGAAALHDGARAAGQLAEGALYCGAVRARPGRL